MLIRLDDLEDGTHVLEWEGSIAGIDLVYPEIASSVRVDARLHRLRDVITIRASLHAELERPCDRTLEPVEVTLDAPMHVVIRQLVHGRSRIEADDETVITADQNDSEVDLTDRIREALIIEMPMVVYSDSSQGTGADEDEASRPSSGDNIDPRWAGLKNVRF